MAFKFVTLLSLFAAASAGLLPAQQSYHGHGGAQIYQQQQPIHSVAAVHAAPAYHAQTTYQAAPAYHAQQSYQAAPAYHAQQSYQAAPAYHAQQAYQSAPAYHAAPALVKTVAAPALVKHVEIEKPANYEFSYSVHDEHTGDIKQQHETRHGDQVQGQYSLLDSDGHHRIVDYTADDHHGFNAVVRREPTGVKVATHQAKILAPVAHQTKLIAPVAHHQQLHAAPLVHSQQIHSAPLLQSQQYQTASLGHAQIHAAPIVHAQQIHSAPLVHSQQIHSAPLLQSGLNGHSAGHSYSSQQIVHHGNEHQAYHH